MRQEISISTFLLLFVVCSLTFKANAQTSNFNVVFYNLLDFPSAAPSNRISLLDEVLDNLSPDIFLVCELENATGAQLILQEALNNNAAKKFAQAPFIENQSSGSDLQQLLFYNTTLFTLENSAVITTSVRDINHYTLRLNTVDASTNPLLLEVFVTHFKASQGNQNEALRLQMAQAFTTALEALSPQSYVLFAGDLNLYSSNEPAYIELLDQDNAIPVVDPLARPGFWHTNLDFRDIHTQSTRVSSAPFGAGAGGGLDDRFDFILLSENLFENPDLEFQPDTYLTIGNNGNCYNESINNSQCDGLYNSFLREQLYQISDHLPVSITMQTEREWAHLSISNFNKNPQFQILYPKENTIRIVSLDTMAASTQCTLRNALGQPIATYTLNLKQPLEISTAHLPKGVYFLTTSSPYTIQKLIVQ